jgi:hypothetical protein
VAAEHCNKFDELSAAEMSIFLLGYFYFVLMLCGLNLDFILSKRLRVKLSSYTLRHCSTYFYAHPARLGFNVFTDMYSGSFVLLCAA